MNVGIAHLKRAIDIYRIHDCLRTKEKSISLMPLTSGNFGTNVKNFDISIFFIDEEVK